MKLQRAAVIETDGKRLVEMLFADTPEPDESEAQIRFVVSVSAEGYLPLATAQLEALRIVRTVIADESERLEQIRGPAD